MTTPNALLGPIKMDAAGNLYVSADGGATWTLQQLPPSDIPLATPSANGLMSANLFAQTQNGAVFETPVIDLTQTGQTAFVMPAMPGVYALAIRSLGFLITAAGTQSTAPTISIGNESTTFANLLASGAATTATAAAHVPALFFATTGVLAVQLLDLSNPIKLNVTVGAAGTGGFAATARFAIQLALVTLT